MDFSHNFMSKLIKYILVGFIGYQTMFGQNPPIPKNHSIIDSIKGDLNNDGIDELVVAYNTQKENEDNFESIQRELVIYKKEKNK